MNNHLEKEAAKIELKTNKYKTVTLRIGMVNQERGN